MYSWVFCRPAAEAFWGISDPKQPFALALARKTGVGARLWSF
jgi:hypothetical protein